MMVNNGFPAFSKVLPDNTMGVDAFNEKKSVLDGGYKCNNEGEMDLKKGNDQAL